MSHTDKRKNLQGSAVVEYHDRRKYWIIRYGEKYLPIIDQQLIDDIEKGWRHFWVKRGYSESIKTCKDINH